MLNNGPRRTVSNELTSSESHRMSYIFKGFCSRIWHANIFRPPNGSCRKGREGSCRTTKSPRCFWNFKFGTLEWFTQVFKFWTILKRRQVYSRIINGRSAKIVYELAQISGINSPFFSLCAKVLQALESRVSMFEMFFQTLRWPSSHVLPNDLTVKLSHSNLLNFET